MATGALTRQFLSSARLTPAHFRSLCVLQRTLQFNPLFAFARAASTATAKKTTSKSTASKPGPKSKTAVKKPGPKPKAAAKGTAKKATPKKAATKKAAAKKPTAKKKPVKKTKALVKKKPAAKKKRVPLTPEQKERKMIQALKMRALDPPKRGHGSGFFFWSKEEGLLGKTPVETGAKWKALPKETKDAYTERAKQDAPAKNKAVEDWIASQPPKVIYDANRARRRLRRLGVKHNTTPFTDPRIPKMAASPALLYIAEQYRSGREFPKDEAGKTSIIENMRVLRSEYQALSTPEKKKYEDESLKQREQYRVAMDQVMS